MAKVKAAPAPPAGSGLNGWERFVIRSAMTRALVAVVIWLALVFLTVTVAHYRPGIPPSLFGAVHLATLIAAITYVLLVPSRAAVAGALLVGITAGVLLGSSTARGHVAAWVGSAKSSVVHLVAQVRDR